MLFHKNSSKINFKESTFFLGCTLAQPLNGLITDSIPRHDFEWQTINQKKKELSHVLNSLIISDPRGARTHDPNIKSVVLYQLS